MTDDEGIPTAAPDVVEGHEVHEHEHEHEPASAAPAPTKSRRGLVVLTVILGVAAFGFAVLAAVVTQRLDEQDGDREEIAMTSHRMGEALLNYDYRDLDAAKRRVLALSTGKFRDEYEKTFDDGLETLLRELKATSEAATEEVFIGPIEDDSVTVLVVVNAVGERTTGRRVLADSYIRLQLVKVGGRWRVDGVTNLNLAAPTTDQPLPGATTTTAPK